MSAKADPNPVPRFTGASLETGKKFKKRLTVNFGYVTMVDALLWLIMLLHIFCCNT